MFLWPSCAPGSPEVGEVFLVPVVEDNQEEAEDEDGKREEEGAEDAQDVSSEVPNHQTEPNQKYFLNIPPL